MIRLLTYLPSVLNHTQQYFTNPLTQGEETSFDVELPSIMGPHLAIYHTSRLLEKATVLYTKHCIILSMTSSNVKVLRDHLQRCINY